MTFGTILLIILILMLVGAFPAWPHSQAWGYGPPLTVTWSRRISALHLFDNEQSFGGERVI
jgi:hypothetical protein